MTPRIQKAIDIFLDAINNGTLAKGTCVACAVGNLVAEGMRGSITKVDYVGGTSFSCSITNSNWAELFATNMYKQEVYPEEELEGDIRTLAYQNIESTDFTKEELMQIEFAFETNT